MLISVHFLFKFNKFMHSHNYIVRSVEAAMLFQHYDYGGRGGRCCFS